MRSRPLDWSATVTLSNVTFTKCKHNGRHSNGWNQSFLVSSSVALQWGQVWSSLGIRWQQQQTRHVHNKQLKWIPLIFHIKWIKKHQAYQSNSRCRHLRQHSCWAGNSRRRTGRRCRDYIGSTGSRPLVTEISCFVFWGSYKSFFLRKCLMDCIWSSHDNIPMNVYFSVHSKTLP